MSYSPPKVLGVARCSQGTQRQPGAPGNRRDLPRIADFAVLHDDRTAFLERLDQLVKQTLQCGRCTSQPIDPQSPVEVLLAGSRYSDSEQNPIRIASRTAAVVVAVDSRDPALRKDFASSHVVIASKSTSCAHKRWFRRLGR